LKRWLIAFGVALFAAIGVLSKHVTDSTLLLDTDTSVLLRTIHAKNAPFSWFWSDWPLYNHFYRPIPTLLFELDQRLYGTSAAGYGWTNALLAFGCTLVLFWFLRELTDRPIASAAGTCLFAMWQGFGPYTLPEYVTWLVWPVLVIGAIRHRKNVFAYLPACFVLLVLAQEMTPVQPLGAKVIGWLPGRTASCMTLFALASMAIYARYERLGPLSSKPKPTATDVPATRSTAVSDGRRNLLWPTASFLLAAAAFASYEQAVMLPACLLGVAVYFRLTGRRPQWGWQAGFWSLILAYLWVRHCVIPPGESHYQAQQVRSSIAGTLVALTPLVFLPLQTYSVIPAIVEGGWLVLFTGQIYGTLLCWISNAVAVFELRRDWALALTGWILSILAFLPMAFLKMFEHYYYWPLAIRTVLVVAIGNVACKLVATALRPPVLQAPPRPSPAPGSLPHPSNCSPAS